MTALVERNVRSPRTWGYFFAFIVLGMAAAIIGPSLPSLAEQTGSQLGAISFLFTARSLGYLVGSLQGGRLLDRLPGHQLLVVVLGIIGVTLLLVPLLPWLWALTLAVLVLGLCEGMLDLGGNVLLLWTHGRDVGPYMNGLHFFFGVGAFLSPLIVGQALLRTGEIDAAYWILAATVVPVGVWLARLSSPVAQVSSQGSSQETARPLLVMLIAVFFFLYVGAEVSYGGWIYTYTLGQFGENMEATAALLASAFWGALTVGRLLSIPLGRRFSHSTLITADLAGCLLSMILLLAWPGSLWVVWAGTLGLGLSMASIFPTVLALAEGRMAITGRVTSWFLVGAGVGGMVLPWLIGQLFEGIGPGVTMPAILIDLVLACGVFFLLLRTFRAPKML